MDRKITVLFLTLKWFSLNCNVFNFKFLSQTFSFTVLEGKKDPVLLPR